MGVAVEPRQYLVDQLLAKADVIRATHERVQLCQRPQTEVALLRESLGVSGINHILREHGHTIFQEREAAKIFDKIEKRSLERFFPGFTVDSSKEATLSTSQSGSGDKRTRDVARPAHLGALAAAKTPNLDMIRDATKPNSCWSSLCWRGWTLPPSWTLLMNQRDPLPGSTCEKQPKQQTNRGIQRHSSPTVTNPAVPDIEQGGSSSQDGDDSEPTLEKSSRCTTGRLRRFKHTLHTKSAWQQGPRTEDLCHTHVSHKWLYHPDACAGSAFTPHDNITNVQKKTRQPRLHELWSLPPCGSFLDSTRAWWNLQHR